LKRTDKIVTIFLLIFGSFLLWFGYVLPITGFHNNPPPTTILFGNILMMLGGLMIAGTAVALVVSYLKLSRTYRGSVVIIFSGAVLNAIPWVQTYDLYGYEFNFTAFPFSFIGYPLIALGVGLIFYSYFTNHLRVEMVQTKEDNKTLSTAKIVWKENTKEQTNFNKTEKEDINTQLMKQHTILTEIDGETMTDSSNSIRYCRYCGVENKNDAAYCEKCGKCIA
jgi:hypothetical protein